MSMEYIALFFTQSGALRFYKSLVQKGFSCDMMQAPRKLSSNCTVAVKFKCHTDVSSLVSSETEKIYGIRNGEYNLVFEAE